MLKPLRDLRHSLFYGVVMRKNIPLLACGDESTGCQWTFCPTGLTKNSIVYSGGVGRDVTFDHALADRFGCNIWLFDPSPTGLETMGLSENSRPEFHFVNKGMSGKDEILRLAPPTNPEEGSWFSTGSSDATVTVDCQCLSTIMRELRHDHVDLLKLDIEGPEYPVIEEILAKRIPINQICVEYHHGMLPGIRRSQTIASLFKLLTSGYSLIHKVGNNHTFIKKDFWNSVS